MPTQHQIIKYIEIRQAQLGLYPGLSEILYKNIADAKKLMVNQQLKLEL